MKFIAGLTLGILVTGAMLRAAEFKLPEGSGGIPCPFVPIQPFSHMPEMRTDSWPKEWVGAAPVVHCYSISPEAIEQIRKAARP